jgi:hypothetical protein
MNSEAIAVKPIAGPLRVVNVGLELFADSLRQQQVEVVQVAWAPPAKGDPELMNILDDLL